MGILTNQTNVNRISNILKKHDKKLGFLSYLIGIAWFLSLAHPEQNGKTYFSENALLPGLVDTDLHHDFGAKVYVEELKSLLTNRYHHEDTKDKIPIQWFLNKFNEIGLEAYSQNYTFQYPYAGPKKQLDGVNVYGIIRAPRAAGVESIILSSPYRGDVASPEATYVGLGLMLALAKAFRAHSYWAKDIIFLITDNEEIGIQAWLASYYHSPTQYIKYGELIARAGSIQAAINIELNSDQFNLIDLRILGLNGQLPNLDLLNTAARLCQRENVLTTFQNRRNINNRHTLNGYWWSLQTMLSMMWRQAGGVPSGNHGYFNKYGIEAVTLHAVKTSASRRHGYLQIGRIIEGILRSLNNLLERFHQSFFFYILPSTDRYVSIGLYMPAFGLILLPLLIKLLSLWVSMKSIETVDSSEPENSKAKSSILIKEEKHNDDDDDDADNDDDDKDVKTSGDVSSKIGKIKEKKQDIKEDGDDVSSPRKDHKNKKNELNTDAANDDDDDDNASLVDIFSCTSLLLICCLFGWMVKYATSQMITLASQLHVEPDDAILLLFIAAHFCMLLCPVILLRSSSRNFNVKLLKCVALFLLALAISCISLINISFATFIGVVSVPFAVIVRPATNKLFSIMQRFLLILISPLSIIYFCCLLNHLVIQLKSKSSFNLVSLLFASWLDVKSNLLSASLQYEMIGSLTYGWMSLLFMPLWMLFWIITFGVWK